MSIVFDRQPRIAFSHVSGEQSRKAIHDATLPTLTVCAGGCVVSAQEGPPEQSERYVPQRRAPPASPVPRPLSIYARYEVHSEASPSALFWIPPARQYIFL